MGGLLVHIGLQRGQLGLGEHGEGIIVEGHHGDDHDAGERHLGQEGSMLINGNAYDTDQNGFILC